MMPPTVEPIRIMVVVNVGVDEAFRLFTERFDAIKPRKHNLLSVPIAKTVSNPAWVGASMTSAPMAAAASGRVSWSVNRPRGSCSPGISVRPGSWSPILTAPVKSKSIPSLKVLTAPESS